MSEYDVIKNTKEPNTVESIYLDLKNLGVEEGDIILVHCSMSKIGWICGGEVAVIQALLKTVGKSGTIVMPAHTGDNSEPSRWGNPPVPKQWFETIRKSMPAFDPTITPTRGMGRIAECFRKHPETVRSNHPQVSFCANGNDKEVIISKHDLTPQFGMNSPLGALYNCNAKVLLLGVGYSNCTCLHLAETMQVKRDRIETGTSILCDGKNKWVSFEDVEFDSGVFEDIGLAYEQNTNLVSIGNIGNASCKVFELRPIVDFALGWMDNKVIG